MQRAVLLILSLASMLGCGAAPAQGASSPPAATQAPSEAQPPAPTVAEPKSSETSEPKNDAAKYLKILEEDGVDGGHRGRIAASSLSEEQFGLSAAMRKTLEAISSEQVDPSQTSRIIAQLIREEPGAMETVKATCGKEWPALLADLEKIDFEKRTPKLLSLCKIPKENLFKKAPELINFSSLLLSLVVQKSLEGRGAISQAERGLAAHLAELHPLDEPGWKN